MRRLEALLRFLFVQYCVAAGMLLTVVPWSHVWDRLVLEMAGLPIFPLVEHPLARGVVSGFGLIHLVWGVHDLYLLLVHRELHRGPSAP